MPKTENKLTSDKMKNKPVGKLLFAMSLPAMISMLVQALYNIVDTAFVSRYDEAGVTALSIANPIQMFMMAFAIGIGVGCNVQIAKKLGEGKKEEANNIARTALVMSFVVSLAFLFVGLFASAPLARIFTKDEKIIDMAVAYLTVVISVNFGMFFEITCSKILQGSGNMIVPMLSQLIGAVLNIILDPIFIFDWGFGLGAQGAAIATVISQITAMCFSLSIVLFKKHDIKISFRKFKLKLSQIANILTIGLPTIVMNAVGAVVIFCFNIILVKLNKDASVNPDDAIAVLGIYFRLQAFVFMPVFGLVQGALPILSYNYGYGDKKRYKQAFVRTIFTAFIIMAIGLIFFQTIPKYLLRIFETNDGIMALGEKALRQVSLCFIPAAFSIVVITVFQSLGNGLNALIMSLSRQLLLLIPLAVLFMYVFGINYVWFSFPLAEFIIMSVFLPLGIVSIHKKFRHIDSMRNDRITIEEINILG